MLRVIETHDRNQQWLGVADIMRAEAHEEANAVLDRHAIRSSITGVSRNGDPGGREGAGGPNLIEDDEDIAILVLAADTGRRARDRLYPASARTPATSPSRSPSCLATSATRTWTRCPDTGGVPPLELPPRGATYYSDGRPQSWAQAIGPAPPKELVMFIQTEPTPNPATLKFLPGRAVLATGTLDMRDRAAAAQSPLAERLFDVAGVSGCVRFRFHRRTKSDGEWQQLKPAILGAIMEHFMSGAPIVTGHDAPASADSEEFFEAKDTETVATIKELIEARVRPAVANDGGDITFRGFKDGIVYLDMKGACSGCPSSTATLRHGIQNLLRQYLPDIVEVRPMA
jgi:Fe-S cluster biogenesis protein NfuA